MQDNRKTWRTKVGSQQAMAMYGYEMAHDVLCLLTVWQADDFDLTLRLSLQGDMPKFSAHVAGNFRNTVTGGGSSKHGFTALLQLLRALRNHGQKRPQVEPLRSTLLKPKPWVWRPMDDRTAHIGICVTRRNVVLALVPIDRVMGRDSICMTFRRQETHQDIQQALLGLYRGIRQDNKERPHYYGNAI